MRSTRYSYRHDDGRSFATYASSPWRAAEYFAWLLELDAADVRCRIVRMPVVGPGLVAGRPATVAAAAGTRR